MQLGELTVLPRHEDGENEHVEETPNCLHSAHRETWLLGWGGWGEHTSSMEVW